MTFDELSGLVARVTFCGGLKAWGAELRFKSAPGVASLALYMHRIPERESGELDGGPVVRAVDLDELTVASMTREGALNWIRQALAQFLVLHELDESILYRGARVFDPHRPEALGSAMRRADIKAERAVGERLQAGAYFAAPWTMAPRSDKLAGAEITSIIVDELVP